MGRREGENREGKEKGRGGRIEKREKNKEEGGEMGGGRKNEGEEEE